MCRAESPALEQFARANQSTLRVVGLGTQDDLKLARDFVAKGGITFSMLWDKSGTTWRSLRIASQPAGILVSPEGKELGRWSGRLDDREDEILAKAR